MQNWVYILGSIEFSLQSDDMEFGQFYIQEILKYLDLKNHMDFFINRKIMSKGWILTICGNNIGSFSDDAEKEIKRFLRYLYKYVAINNITISIYSDEGGLTNIDSSFLDNDLEIQSMDKEVNYDYDEIRTKNQKKYLYRFTSREWCKLKDKCMNLSDNDFSELVEVVTKTRKGEL